MNVNIQTQRFTVDSKLKSFIERKMEKLRQYNDHILNIDVYLKLDSMGQKVKDKIAEIQVLVPRQRFFVKQTSKSFEESIDLALDSLINQIKRKKERMIA